MNTLEQTQISDQIEIRRLLFSKKKRIYSIDDSIDDFSIISQVKIINFSERIHQSSTILQLLDNKQETYKNTIFPFHVFLFLDSVILNNF